MLGLTVSLQMLLSLCQLSVYAQSSQTQAASPEAAINNSSLPLAQPAPSHMVQKIWSSLDLRKLRKKELAVKPDAASDPGTADTGSAKADPVSAPAPAAVSEPALNLSKLSDKGSALPEKESSKAESASDLFNEVSSKSGQSEAVQSQESRTASQPEQSPANSESAASLPPAQETSTDLTAARSLESNTSTESDSEKESGPINIASNLISLPPGSVLGRMKAQNEECLVVDNDELEEVEEGIPQEELPTDDGKTHVKAGARFPVVIQSQITSKTAKKGDPIQARLKYDLKIGDRLVAKKGAVVNGHINYVLKARTILRSLVSPERWYRNSGCVGLAFDEVISDKGEHLPLVAQPARQARIVKNKAEGRELGVNHYGQVTGPWAVQLRHKAIRIGLNAALAPAGVFSFGAMPVALGVLGAANPSFAFSKPVGLNVRHRRIKGFAWGFLSGIPGSWLIEDTTVKGQEAIIKPGDEFYVEIVQEFTGEPASDAQLMPGASTKLHGQILDENKKTNQKSKQKSGQKSEQKK